jgi:predicted phosphodiesterase
LECLAHRQARTVEIFDGIVAVIIYDKGLLDEEDMLPASVLIFGRSADPVIRKVGPRTFVSPGPAAHPKGGVALLEDQGTNVQVTIYGPDGHEVSSEAVTQMGRVGKMTVQGAS